MDRTNRIKQRIFIMLPVLIVFYYYLFKTKLPIVYILATIQLTTHFYLLFTNNQCNPNNGKICNIFALLIGISFFGIIVYKKLGVIPLLISIYMIISHLITINLIEGTFVYQNINLPIFNFNSYMFILATNFHETKLSKLLDVLVNNTEGCIIDAGAYIGDSTIILAKKYPERTFYLIEPSTNNYKFIGKIKSDNVKLLQTLLSDGNKTYSTDDDVNKANASFKESFTMESKTIDELVTEKVGIMHYDVEGMELEVVKGSLNSIEKYRPIVIVETLEQFKDKTSQIIDIFENIQYQFLIVNESCAATDIFDKTKCRNYIFMPTEKYDEIIDLFKDYDY